MHITWHGLSCIKIQTQDTQLLINPYQDSTGISMPKLKVDIVASTDPEDDQANNFQRLQGEPFLITNPGEYEVKGVFIYGVLASGGRTLFVIEAEGMKLGHPGFAATELTNGQVQLFEGVDVLFLPVTDPSKARSIMVSQIEPRVIIPIQYKTPKVQMALDTIDAFAKEMGVPAVQPEKKVILKAKDLPAEETQVIVLDPA